MKRILILLITMTLVAGMCSCGNSDIPTARSQELQQSSEKQQENMNKVLCIKETYYDGDTDSPISYWVEYEYDELGNQIKSTKYNADGTVDRWNVMDYDEQGNQTKVSAYDSTGFEKSWTEYTYNEFGQEVEYLHYSMNNGTAKLEYRSTREYDAEGNMTVWKDIWDKYTRETVYEYDSAGNVIKVETSDTNDPIPCLSEYEYDNKGDMKKCTYYNAEGAITGWYEYEYEYDNNDRMTKYTNIYYKQDGSVLDSLVIDFNEFGEYSKYTDYNADGTARRTILYEYE